MYFNPNQKWYGFTYKNTPYSSGTKLIYNGKCHLEDSEIILNNQIATYLYTQNNKVYFEYDNKIHTCLSWEFTNRIVKIVIDKKQIQGPQTQKTEFYWSDDMVTKTLWYIVIMIVAIIFKDCIGIWILATIVWYSSTFKK